MPILAVRIDKDAIQSQDYETVVLYFKAISPDRWFWASHLPEPKNKEPNPHWHWFLDTETTDNAVRSFIKRHLMATGNKAYSVRECRDLDKYGSYVCFQESTIEYEIHGFDAETKFNWEQRGLEIIRNRGELPNPGEPNTKNPKSKIDWLALCFEELGQFRAGYYGDTEYEEAQRYMTWVRKHKCLKLYGHYKNVYMAWKDASVHAYFVGDGEDDCPIETTKSRSQIRKEILEYKHRILNELMNHRG